MNDKPHFHTSDDGFLIKCYHKTRLGISDTLGSTAFWIGVTLSYPIEHYIWENVWPFKLIMAFFAH